jgi:alpha-1,2-mannosyltransferase
MRRSLRLAAAHVGAGRPRIEPRSAARFGLDAEDVTNLLVFAVLPAVCLAWILRLHGLGWDFQVYFQAAQHYVSGRTPYPGHQLAALAGKQVFVYPAPMAALLAPLTLLPYTVALGLWIAGSVAALAGALWLLGVRDWRCFGALFLTIPVLQGVRAGTLMPVLTLLLALLWRYRDNRTAAALLAAVLVISKVFLFPLLAWLAVTRRSRTALLAAAISALACLLAWLPIGLGSAADYPSLLHSLSRYEQTFSFSATALGLELGLPASVAMVVALSAGAALLIRAAAVGAKDEFLALRLALAASFVMSPIVWGHYFVLLLVPLALRWPRLSPVWFVAIWIQVDTSVTTKPLLWIVLALLVMLIQLDLVPRVARRWRFDLGTAPFRLVATAGIGLLLLVSAATANTGERRRAVLWPVTRNEPVSATALVRVESAAHRLCWRVWTEGFGAGPAVLAVEAAGTSHGREAWLLRIGAGGQARRCVNVAGHGGLVQGLLSQPRQYRVRLTVRGLPTVAGTVGAGY